MAKVTFAFLKFSSLISSVFFISLSKFFHNRNLPTPNSHIFGIRSYLLIVIIYKIFNISVTFENLDPLIHISLKLLPSIPTSKPIRNIEYLIDKRARKGEPRPALIVFIVIFRENWSSLTTSLTSLYHTRRSTESAPTTPATETRLRRALNIAKSVNSNPRCSSGWPLLTKVFPSHFSSIVPSQSTKPSTKRIVSRGD